MIKIHGKRTTLIYITEFSVDWGLHENSIVETERCRKFLFGQLVISQLSQPDFNATKWYVWTNVFGSREQRYRFFVTEFSSGLME